MPVYRFYFDNHSKFVEDNLKNGLDYRFCHAIFYAKGPEEAKNILNSQCKIKKENGDIIENAWEHAVMSTSPDTKRSKSFIKECGNYLEIFLDTKEKQDLYLVCNTSPEWNYKEDITNWIMEATTYLEIASKKGHTHSILFVDQLCMQALSFLDVVKSEIDTIVSLYLTRANVLIGINENELAIQDLHHAISLLKKYEANSENIYLDDIQYSCNLTKEQMANALNSTYANIYHQLTFDYIDIGNYEKGIEYSTLWIEYLKQRISNNQQNADFKYLVLRNKKELAEAFYSRAAAKVLCRNYTESSYMPDIDAVKHIESEINNSQLLLELNPDAPLLTELKQSVLSNDKYNIISVLRKVNYNNSEHKKINPVMSIIPGLQEKVSPCQPFIDKYGWVILVIVLAIIFFSAA